MSHTGQTGDAGDGDTRRRPALGRDQGARWGRGSNRSTGLTRWLPVALMLATAWTPVAVAASETNDPAATGQDVVAKTDTAGDELLLPWFEVDTTNVNGITTLLAVRNEGATSTDVTFEYYRTDGPQAPQHSETFTLGPKAVKTINIRFVTNLTTDADGFRRGYVIVRGASGAALSGDTFQITPGDNFANGSRLLNIDTTSPDNELCNLFSMRFLNGGGFDSGTVYTVWVDLPLTPDGTDPVLDILAYDEAGDLLIAREVFADQVAFQITALELLDPVVESFGAIEFQFRDGAVGTVNAVLNASGRYSVGFGATCGDL